MHTFLRNDQVEVLSAEAALDLVGEDLVEQLEVEGVLLCLLGVPCAGVGLALAFEDELAAVLREIQRVALFELGCRCVRLSLAVADTEDGKV